MPCIEVHFDFSKFLDKYLSLLSEPEEIMVTSDNFKYCCIMKKGVLYENSVL